ncbi:replication initiator [Micromonospora chalcea]|uniref:replication initiator n=1 Tax=Micromonospora chalcea TaxID=1874 RepID=UPI0033C6E7D3
MMSPHPVPTDLGGLVRVATSTGLAQQVGQCRHPVAVAGSSLLVERGTGRIVERLDPTTSPGRMVGLRCRSRRASVCPACSALYKLDAYHLIAAGLHGGKDTPPQVAYRPRLFVTVTAPSFGPVHLGPDRHGQPRPCHPRTRRAAARRSCGRWHPAADPAIGTPLDPAGYDYPGQVLFNAHVGLLWARLTTETRRGLAAAAGLPRAVAARQVRVVFAKVAEFQARGVVHLHAIVRLDGADGPSSAPAGWASVDLLEHAIRAAIRRVEVATPACRRVPVRRLRWGRQVDVRPITRTDGVSETVVARYVAKYATKAAEAAGIDLGPIYCRACDGHGTHRTTAVLCHRCAGTGRRPGVSLRHLSGHARRLVDTCWWLGAQPGLGRLRLRRYAHTLGFRGHFATTSRTYSTTFTALRVERRNWMAARRAERAGVDPAGVLVVGDWRNTGPGGGA